MVFDDNVQEELKEAILNMFRVLARDHTIYDGVISEVNTTPGDPNQYTCTVTVSDSLATSTFTNVPLETLKGVASSFILIPNINSKCLLCNRDGTKDRPQIFKINSVNKIIAAPTTWQFGTGSNGGLPMTPDLVDRLNLIENDINTLKKAFAAWVVVADDGGAALKAITATWFGTDLVETVASDVENPNISQ